MKKNKTKENNNEFAMTMTCWFAVIKDIEDVNNVSEGISIKSWL